MRLGRAAAVHPVRLGNPLLSVRRRRVIAVLSVRPRRVIPVLSVRSGRGEPGWVFAGSDTGALPDMTGWC